MAAARARLRHGARSRSTARTSRRSTRRRARRASTPSPARARCSSTCARTGSPATTSATRRSTATRARCASCSRPTTRSSCCGRGSASSDDEFERIDERGHRRGRGVGRVRQGRHRPGARGRARVGVRRGDAWSRRVPELTYREAVRDALSQVMRRDDRVFIMGEDIAEMGGSMGVTQGMLDEFGAERVRNTPDLRDRDRRRRHRRGDPGDAAGGRDHVRGLPHDLDGADRQPGGEAPDDVGRAGEGAADDPHAGWRRLVAGSAARAAARGVVRPRARAEGRLRLHARGRARPALVVDLRPQPGHLLRAPHAVPDQGRRARRDRRRSSSARRASTARAPT